MMKRNSATLALLVGAPGISSGASAYDTGDLAALLTSSRCRGCLGPLLIDVDKGLMNDGRDKEAPCPVHPREIRISGSEGVGHPHGGQRLRQTQ